MIFAHEIVDWICCVNDSSCTFSFLSYCEQHCVRRVHYSPAPRRKSMDYVSPAASTIDIDNWRSTATTTRRSPTLSLEFLRVYCAPLYSILVMICTHAWNTIEPNENSGTATVTDSNPTSSEERHKTVMVSPSPNHQSCFVLQTCFTHRRSTYDTIAPQRYPNSVFISLI
ncbi:hypothetical protein ABKN59_010021 [Abortiporus biennis]